MAGDPAKPFRSFSCRNCGGEVQIKATGWSLHVACRYCGTIFDAEDFSLIQKAQKDMFTPLIPLGRRGKLKGQTWELIGALERSEQDGAYTWQEYLIFNPFQGYRWLVQSGGHWSFVKSIKGKPKVSGYQGHLAVYKNKKFRLFAVAEARVDKVIGEFYWRVQRGEKVKARDFVAAPEMLSQELTANEVSWSLGTYMEGRDIAKAFGVENVGHWPAKKDVGPHQPSPYASGNRKLWQTCFAFLLALVVLQCVFSLWAPAKTVFQGNFDARASTPGSSAYGTAPEVSPSFELSGHLNNLEVRLYSDVDQGWVGVDWELVRESDQAVIEHGQSVEHYSGYDSDGSWSEGSHDSSELLTDIEPGRYHLNLYGSYEPAPNVSKAAQAYSIHVVRGVTSWSNFILATLALVFVPVLSFFRSRNFEMVRWQDSDYSPYES